MNKIKRNERIAAMVKILSDTPNKVYTFNYFTELFDSAKSTISEDLVIVKRVMEDLEIGKILTIAGAAGGVKYIPSRSLQSRTDLLNKICDEVRNPNRIMPGQYLYIADILCNPHYVKGVGDLFAEYYSGEYSKVDYVLTIETKGIPIAMMTAQALGVPLVIARHVNKITEGPKISINYVSGSTGVVQTMYIAKNAIKKGSRVLIVDDFMKAGGTAKGMIELVKELECEKAGVCVLFETKEPESKLVSDYQALITYEGIQEDGSIKVNPIKKCLLT